MNSCYHKDNDKNKDKDRKTNSFRDFSLLSSTKTNINTKLFLRFQLPFVDKNNDKYKLVSDILIAFPRKPGDLGPIKNKHKYKIVLKILPAFRDQKQI